MKRLMNVWMLVSIILTMLGTTPMNFTVMPAEAAAPAVQLASVAAKPALEIADLPVEGYRNIRLPFPAGTDYLINTWHVGTARHAIDFLLTNDDKLERKVSAIHGGTVKFSGWSDRSTGYAITIDHGDGFCSVYYHLLEGELKVEVNDIVDQGQYIAIAGCSGNPTCNYEANSVLHVAVMESAGCVSLAHDRERAMIFDEKPEGELTSADINLESQNVSTLEATLSLPDNLRNLIHNGDFAAAPEELEEQHWSFIDDVERDIRDGLLYFKGVSGGQNASVVQDIYYPIPVDSPFNATVQLGNASNVAKHVTIGLHDPEGSTGSVACDFTLPANSPMQTYNLQGVVNYTSDAWNRLRFEVWTRDFDSVPDITMDNANVRYLSLSASEVQQLKAAPRCFVGVSPTAICPSPNTTYCDAPTDHWAYDAIEILTKPNGSEPGYIGGATDENGHRWVFPDDPFTKELFIYVLTKLYHGIPNYIPTRTYQGRWADLPADNKRALYLEEAYELGILRDSDFCHPADAQPGKNYICPGETLEGPAIMRYIARAKGWDLTQPALGIFADLKQDTEEARAVEAGYWAGVTGGCTRSPLTFCLTSNRDRTFIFLARAFGLLPVTPRPRGLESLDSDGDGITDFKETHGWQTLSGWYLTNPQARDTDHGGVDDDEEGLAGTAPSSQLLPLDGRAAVEINPAYDDVIPLMATAIKQVEDSDPDLDVFWTYVKWLSGAEEYPYGVTPVTIESRAYNSQGIKDVRVLIEHELEMMGFTSGVNLRILPWAYSNRTGINYEICVTGNCANDNGTKRIYILMAHYDSRATPGADDNASGVAAALEAAYFFKVLHETALTGDAQYGFQNEIRIVLVDGEELGKYGSSQYVTGLDSSTGKPQLPLGARSHISGVVNLDMIGGKQNVNEIRVRCRVDKPFSKGFTGALLSLLNLNDIRLNPSEGDKCTDSDQVSFFNEGIPAIQIRDMEALDVHVHTPSDTIEHMEPAYFRKVAIATIQTLAYFGRYKAPPGYEFSFSVQNQEQATSENLLFQGKSEILENVSSLPVAVFSPSSSEIPFQWGETVTQTVRDDDGDRYYNRLLMDVPLTVQPVGSFSATLTNTVSYEAYLYAPNGQMVGFFGDVVTLTVGEHSLPLEFDGGSIYQKGLDGPYTLTLKVSLSLDEEISHPEDAYHVYQTYPYLYTQFEPPAVHLDPRLEEYVFDMNGDARYDRLVLESALRVTQPGRYTINALLADASGEHVAPWFMETYTLTPGTVPLTLLFDGGTIGEEGVDGPYYLRQVSIFNADTGELIDQQRDVYTTTAYAADNFGADSFTIVPLDSAQTDRRAAYRAVFQALMRNERPLFATAPFTVSIVTGTLNLPAGTVILQGRVDGGFAKQIVTGRKDFSAAWVLYPPRLALFESAGSDSGRSWDIPDARRALETYPWLAEWPQVDEANLAGTDLPFTVYYLGAGVPADTLNRFPEAAFPARAGERRLFIVVADGWKLAEKAGLIPHGMVTTVGSQPHSATALRAAGPALPGAALTYNWPEGMTLQRASDTPNYNLPAGAVRIADYADTGEAAMVMVPRGADWVILISGHPAQQELSYGLLYQALFIAGSEPVDTQVSVQVPFIQPADLQQEAGAGKTVIPLEAGVPQTVRVALQVLGSEPLSDVSMNLRLARGYTLTAAAQGGPGIFTVTELVTETLLTWSAATLAPGSYELQIPVENSSAEVLQQGEVHVTTQGEVAYSIGTRRGQLSLEDAVVWVVAPPLIVHTTETDPEIVYPSRAEGDRIQIQESYGNNQSSSAYKVNQQVTFLLAAPVQGAFDQNQFPYVVGTEENGWFIFEIGGNSLCKGTIPVGFSGCDWRIALRNWRGERVRLPNPNHRHFNIPPQLQGLIVQDPNDGDLWLPAMTLEFKVGTLLSYDDRSKALNYQIRARELSGQGISFHCAPVEGTRILEGCGGSVYYTAGSSPIPFREYLPNVGINYPQPRQAVAITYRDMLDRVHVLTDTTHALFYDIAPYSGSGYERSHDVDFACTYQLTDRQGNRLQDYPAYLAADLELICEARSRYDTVDGENVILQIPLPHPPGHNIQYIGWKGAGNNCRLLEGQPVHAAEFDLVTFQCRLPQGETQRVTVRARLDAYPGYPREGDFPVSFGGRIAYPVEWGGPGFYDIITTPVWPEISKQPNLQTAARVNPADVSRQGGSVDWLVHIDASADVRTLTDEVCVNSTGAGDWAVRTKVGGSLDVDHVYECRTAPGKQTLLEVSVSNLSRDDWSGVDLSCVSGLGLHLTRTLSDTWPASIPYLSHTGFRYRVDVDAAATVGVMHPVTCTLTGNHVPDGFSVPIAYVGVGESVRYIEGQVEGLQIQLETPLYVHPGVYKGMDDGQFFRYTTITNPVELAAFTAALTRTFTCTSVPAGDRYRLTCTPPEEWQTLPAQQNKEFLQEFYLLLSTGLDLLQAGTHIVGYPTLVQGQDDFMTSYTAASNAVHVTWHGPEVTDAVGLLSVSVPYKGDTLFASPGQPITLCLGVDLRNEGNYRASTLSSTLTVAPDFAVTGVDPEPSRVNGRVITWNLPDLLPYTGEGSSRLLKLCGRMVISESRRNGATDLAQVPLIVESQARYEDRWGAVPYILDSVLSTYTVTVAPAGALSYQIYLPIVVRAYAYPITFPHSVGSAIASRPAITGEVFYSTTLVMPPTLPVTGHFYLSAHPDRLVPVVVDDAVALLVGDQEVFQYQFSRPGNPPSEPIPAVVEIPMTVMQPLAGKTVRLEYRDVFGVLVAAGEVWLIWTP